MRRVFLTTTAVLSASAALIAATDSTAHEVRAQWTGMIMGLGTSKIHGEAIMRPGKDAGTTEVTLSFTGDAPAMTRPWHVHIGTCANGTGVLGGTKAYTPLVGDANGAGKMTVIVPVPMPTNGDYSINFHDSPTRMATYVACGDLKFAK